MNRVLHYVEPCSQSQLTELPLPYLWPKTVPRSLTLVSMQNLTMPVITLNIQLLMGGYGVTILQLVDLVLNQHRHFFNERSYIIFYDLIDYAANVIFTGHSMIAIRLNSFQEIHVPTTGRLSGSLSPAAIPLRPTNSRAMINKHHTKAGAIL